MPFNPPIRINLFNILIIRIFGLENNVLPQSVHKYLKLYFNRSLPDDHLPGIGATYANRIQAWQQSAYFGPDALLVCGMIRQDAERTPELTRQIRALEEEIARVATNAAIACQIASIPRLPWSQRKVIRQAASPLADSKGD